MFVQGWAEELLLIMAQSDQLLLIMAPGEQLRAPPCYQVQGWAEDLVLTNRSKELAAMFEWLLSERGERGLARK